MSARLMLAMTMVVVGVPAAWAWHEPDEFPLLAHGPTPGGGRLYGTGSARDEGQLCADCHITKGNFTVTFTFSPALNSQRYVPGQLYQVTMHLAAERIFGATRNLNGVNARFENAAGAPAGQLRGSSVFSIGGTCPTFGLGGARSAAGSTVTFSPCEVVLSRESMSNDWVFSWTSPVAGSGPVDILWGGVDGNADIKSSGDESAAGVIRLTEGP